MNILRKIALSLLVIGFSGLIFVMPALWTLRMTVMDRNVTTGWLRDSKVYDNFVNALAETAEKQLQEEEESSSADQDIDIAALSRAAKVAFPSEVLQDNVESVLDGAYNWLEGSSEKLTFNLDLTDEKKLFIDALGNEALTRASALPACPEGQLPESFDPLTAECLPAGASIQAEIDKIKNEVATSSEVLPDTQLSGDDIKIDVNGQQKPLDEAFSEGPTWYQRISWLPLAVTVLLGLGAILIIFLARPRRGGLKVLAWLFAPAGLLLLIAGAAGKVIANRFENGDITIGSGENNIAEKVVLPLLQEMNKSFAKWNLIFGATYLGASLVLAIIYLVLRPKKPSVATPDIEDKPGIQSQSSPPKTASKALDTKEPTEVKGPPVVPKDL